MFTNNQIQPFYDVSFLFHAFIKVRDKKNQLSYEILYLLDL